MSLPWSSWNDRSLQGAFRLSLVFTAAVGAALLWQGQFLRTAHAPLGMVSWELSFGSEALAAMRSDLGPEAQAKLGFSLGLDFLFMPAYSTAIASALLLQHRRKATSRVPILTALVWAQWAAAGLDGVENVALYQAVVSGPTPELAWTASLAASAKFALLGAGLAALALGKWRSSAKPLEAMKKP